MKRFIVLLVVVLFGCAEDGIKTKNGFTWSGNFHRTPDSYYKDDIDVIGDVNIMLETNDQSNHVLFHDVTVGAELGGHYVYVYGEDERTSEIDGVGIMANDSYIMVGTAWLKIIESKPDFVDIDYEITTETGELINGHYSGKITKVNN